MLDIKKTFCYTGGEPSAIEKKIFNSINNAFGGDDQKSEVLKYKKGGDVGRESRAYGGSVDTGEPIETGLPYKKGGATRRCNHAEGEEIHIKHPGALHREMGIPEGTKIPMRKLQEEKVKAKRDGDKTLMKRVVFAENFRGK